MSTKFLSLAFLLLLSSCGFSPLHGTMGSEQRQTEAAETGLDRVQIAIIPDREGQYLRNALIDRFYRGGLPSNPAYRLEVEKISESISDFDITIESEATRRQLKLTTTIRLIDLQTGKEAMRRSLVAITSHNVLESKFSTLVTEQSAREAALSDLARQIERHLSLFFT